MQLFGRTLTSQPHVKRNGRKAEPHALEGRSLHEAIQCVTGNGGKLVVYAGAARSVFNRHGDFSVSVRVQNGIVVKAEQKE